MFEKSNVAASGLDDDSNHVAVDLEFPLIRDLMRLKPDELTPNGWAVKAGVSRTVWADMRRHGNPSRRTLEKLLAAAGSSLAEFEALRVGEVQPPHSAAGGSRDVRDARATSWRPAPLSSIPVVASAMAGEWEAGSQVERISIDPANVVGQVDRPISLAGDSSAYAVTIIGDSMWPRFRPGRRVIVSPKAPVEIGDDVIVTLRGRDAAGVEQGSPAMIKEITRRSADHVELRQFNPDRSFRVDAGRIADIHKVVGETI